MAAIGGVVMVGAGIADRCGTLPAADTATTGPAKVTPLTLSSVSEIARLVQLEAGRDLIARGDGRAPADRVRAEKA